MFRIKTPTAQGAKFPRWPTANAGDRDAFTDGNPLAGTPSTQLEADWFDMVQEEIAAVIELNNFALLPNDPVNGGTYRQLHDAIDFMIDGKLPSIPDLSGYLPITGGTLIATGGGAGGQLDINGSRLRVRGGSSPGITLYNDDGGGPFGMWNSASQLGFGPADFGTGTPTTHWAAFHPDGRFEIYNLLRTTSETIRPEFYAGANFGPSGQVWIAGNGNVGIDGTLNVGGYTSVNDLRSDVNIIAPNGAITALNGYINDRLRVDVGIDFNVGQSAGWIDCSNGNAEFRGTVYISTLQVNNDARVFGRCTVGDFESEQNVFVPNGYVATREIRAEPNNIDLTISGSTVVYRRGDREVALVTQGGIHAIGATITSPYPVALNVEGRIQQGAPSDPNPGGVEINSIIVYPATPGGTTAISSRGHIDIPGTANGGGDNFRGFQPGGGEWQNSTSERRFKEDIRPYTRGLEAIRQLSPINYRYKARGGHPASGVRFIGLAVDDLGDVMPEMICEASIESLSPNSEPELVKGLDASPLKYALVNAVKELAARLEALEGALGRGP